jgi:competence protein ComEC
LFLGLVIGDDRAEPADLVADFRRTGLSHLTAVSGQNIGFLLIAFRPLLTRLRPRWRWIATVGLIGWFALLTRFEPSVLRAGVMAVLAATVFWRGWQASPLRLLAITVIGLTLIDPLISRSIGWWLSAGATAGIALLARPLAERLPGPRWLAEPTAASLAAQIGVMPVGLLVFHRLPLLGLVANLLAGAPAGFVMVWGIPAALVGGALPWLAPLIQFPSLITTRWVLVVARVMAAAEPDTPIWVAGIGHLLLVAVPFVRRARATRP